MNTWLQPQDTPTSTPQNVARVLLGGALLFAGVSHMTFAREEFTAQVPELLTEAPLNLSEDFVVLASGVAEMSLGTALLFGKNHKHLAGLATAAFFVAIFPGNISQYLTRTDAFHLDTDQKRLARLFFQPVLVAWALWGTGLIGSKRH